MPDKFTPVVPVEKNIADILRDTLMVIFTLLFVLLYAAAFSGKLDPLRDNTLIARLEPIILILTTFYFARLSARHYEKNLNREIIRQTQKAEAAQYAKEQAQQERESLEERIKNAKTVLKAINLSEKKTDEQSKTTALKTALKILDS